MSVQGVTVLVVQREPLVALDLKAALEGVGAQILLGTSYVTATEAIRAGGLAFCVLDDGQWSDGTSAELAALLRVNAIPFLVYGASSQPLAGSVAHLQKPAPSTDVVDAFMRHFAPTALEARRAAPVSR